MRPALRLYRESYRASDVLAKPSSMTGVTVIAAETDEQARRLATSQQQRMLNLIRNRPGPIGSRVDEVDCTPLEREAQRDCG